MRWPPLYLLILSLASLTLAQTARAGEVAASPPQALSVTIYRNPDRAAGSISLDQLGGFALVTETRTVHLPVGESKLRFEGVVDGIQPESAIITGLPEGVVEKNRDAALLSPEALIRAAAGSDLTLVRTNRKTGKISRTKATIRSANDQGVVFETADGVEALQCSGLPETFRYERLHAGLTSTPTLSALTRTREAVTATVTLSYLAQGFDWAADYVARINPDGATLNLGAWVTLANGNGVGLPDAATQVVAGRLNRAGADYAPVGDVPRTIAHCWPQGTTSDPADPTGIGMVSPDGMLQGEVNEVIVTAMKSERMFKNAPLAAPAPPPPPPPPEQLGDLKLYRVSQSTTVAARQSKQVRLLEQAKVPFARLCTADLPATGEMPYQAAGVLLRTKNTQANSLGLPLPSGGVAVFDRSAGRELLVGQASLHDTAVDEDVELQMGANPDVQVRQTRLSYTAKAPALLKLTPELALAFRRGETVEEVEITNARATTTPFELRLITGGVLRVAAADQPMGMKDGRPIFRLTLPANGAVKVHYTVSQ